RKSILLFFLLLLVDLYGGNREGLSMPVVAGGLIYISNFHKVRVIKFWRLLMGMTAMGVLLVIYKGFYKSVKAKDWLLVKLRLTDARYWLESFTTMEPFTTQNILNQTINYNIQFPMWEWIRPAFHNFILFSTSFGIETIKFGHYFTNQLYSYTDIGL